MTNTSSIVLLSAALATTAACAASGATETTPLPLAQIKANVVLQTSPSEATLVISDSRCASLESSVVARLDDLSGAIDHDATWVEEEVGAFRYETFCLPPSVRWGLPAGAASDAAASIALDDGKTTWTMIVDRPAAVRTFDGITDGATLKAGSVASLRMTPASGTIDVAQARVVFEGATTRKTLWGGADVAVDGHQLSFVVPAVVATEPVRVSVIALVQHSILECTGPASCKSEQSYERKLDVTLEP
jgi:hypothetical protein